MEPPPPNPHHQNQNQHHLTFDDDALPTGSLPLGSPLPADSHACSVSLPTWSSVVGYEEGHFEVTSQLKCGYPRFVYHPYVLQLVRVVLNQQKRRQQYRDEIENISSSSSSSYSATSRKKQDCLVLPSQDAALRCQAFLQRALYQDKTTDLSYISSSTSPTTTTNNKNDNNNNHANIRVVNLETPSTNVHAVLFPAETSAGMEAKAYWQHTGEIVSSRRAEATLRALGVTPTSCLSSEPCRHDYQGQDTTDNTSPLDLLKQRIASLTKVPTDHVYLTPSGMASIYMALLSSRRLQGSQKALTATSIVFGFPYLDTLKLCSRPEICPGGVEFFGHGNQNDLRDLSRYLQQKSLSSSSVCALFTEVPSNPLLQCPNLEELRKLADHYNFALIVDDTIGNFANVELLESGLADGICTSLTKIFSGRGDAMAGSLVVNPHTRMGQLLQQDLQQYEPSRNDTTSTLFSADAWAVYHNSDNFLQRNEQINRTAEGLADYLQGHPDVARVYYPKYQKDSSDTSTTTTTTMTTTTTKNPYEQYATKSMTPPHHYNYGGLLSILLDSHMCQRTFYDALQVAKGPSLGTNFTLVCPYTLLAHYHELDFCLAYHVPPSLLRISVGLESLKSLTERFDHALSTSRLYPKVHPKKKTLSTASAPPLSTRSFATSAYSPMTTTTAAATTPAFSTTTCLWRRSSFPTTTTTSLASGAWSRRAWKTGLRLALRGRG